MACLEIKNPGHPDASVDFSRFTSLGKQPKKILNDQFEYAWKLRELPPEQHFSSFLLAWNLLASTAEITTGENNTDAWYVLIRSDPAWAGKFNTVMENPKSLLRMYANRFAGLWPIFDTEDLIANGLLIPDPSTRAETIAYYYQHDAKKYLPECWMRHLKEAKTPLPDWEHTLSAWFEVRWNLFKDPQWVNTENNTRIVSNAFLSLIYFFKESKLYFEHPSLKPDIFDRTQVLSSL